MKILLLDTPYGSLHAEPHISVKCFADSSLVTPGRPLFLPDIATDWRIQATAALRISRLGKNIAPRFARRYYDAATILLRLLPQNAPQLPTGIEQIFDSALYIFPWQPLPDDTGRLHADIFGEHIDLNLLPDHADQAISLLSRYGTLKMGDIILPFTLEPTPAVTVDNLIEATLFGTALPALRIK